MVLNPEDASRATSVGLVPEEEILRRLQEFSRIVPLIFETRSAGAAESSWTVL